MSTGLAWVGGASVGRRRGEWLSVRSACRKWPRVDRSVDGGVVGGRAVSGRLRGSSAAMEYKAGSGRAPSWTGGIFGSRSWARSFSSFGIQSLYFSGRLPLHGAYDAGTKAAGGSSIKLFASGLSRPSSTIFLRTICNPRYGNLIADIEVARRLEACCTRGDFRSCPATRPEAAPATQSLTTLAVSGRSGQESRMLDAVEFE